MEISYLVAFIHPQKLTSDYVLGATTCCLFLSLRYHRLHPEYIYNRIQKLGKEYSLRILLIMVDIVPAHTKLFADRRITTQIHLES